jgi:hypothetical protein
MASPNVHGHQVFYSSGAEGDVSPIVDGANHLAQSSESQHHSKEKELLGDRNTSETRGGLAQKGILWSAQILPLLFSFGSFVAIIIILKKYDGHLQPSWRHGITLNAVVAVLATALRACIATVAEEGTWSQKIIRTSLTEE